MAAFAGLADPMVQQKIKQGWAANFNTQEKLHRAEQALVQRDVALRQALAELRLLRAALPPADDKDKVRVKLLVDQLDDDMGAIECAACLSVMDATLMWQQQQTAAMLSGGGADYDAATQLMPVLFPCGHMTSCRGCVVRQLLYDNHAASIDALAPATELSCAMCRQKTTLAALTPSIKGRGGFPGSVEKAIQLPHVESAQRATGEPNISTDELSALMHEVTLRLLAVFRLVDGNGKAIAADGVTAMPYQAFDGTKCRGCDAAVPEGHLVVRPFKLTPKSRERTAALYKDDPDGLRRFELVFPVAANGGSKPITLCPRCVLCDDGKNDGPHAVIPPPVDPKTFNHRGEAQRLPPVVRGFRWSSAPPVAQVWTNGRIAEVQRDAKGRGMLEAYAQSVLVASRSVSSAVFAAMGASLRRLPKDIVAGPEYANLLAAATDDDDAPLVAAAAGGAGGAAAEPAVGGKRRASDVESDVIDLTSDDEDDVGHREKVPKV